jgi:hypothetical protein
MRDHLPIAVSNVERFARLKLTMHRSDVFPLAKIREQAEH